ncbi:thioredoxin domain-containing protein [Propionimicrobium sp. PCR01-08-3]|uniref:DsbA family protein n=1 Tax=Propionimicrobium sp. PCR01-08-3 TaxID=3052086 RepID=UPI00255C4CE9|nr:thioredoxin domain-containing protein [Propionimicrobium sp. PCR01-08-3]WIY83507.1 thioredoxin domain-containing protein [Propionimicrobium sp. PCR01-08-3]
MSKSKQNKPKDSSGKSASGKGTTPRAASASRREQLRAQQLAEAKRKRTQRIITAAAAVLAVVIIVVVIVVAVQNRKDDEPGTGSSPSSTVAQQVPAQANADNSGLIYNGSDQNSADLVVDVYMDYQCPGCGQLSELVEPDLETLADNGEIQLTYHVLHGLDGSFPGDHSYRAAIGATCAALQDVFPAYSHTVFAGQPATEGDGWTDKQLSEDYPKLVGLEGDALTEFQTCYSEQATADFVKAMQDALPSYVTATPYVEVNGNQWQPGNDEIGSTDAVRQGLERAAG